MDNVFIERFRHPLKHEAVHLDELTSGIQVNRAINDWVDFHNYVQPRSALGGITPAMAYERKTLTWRKAA